MSHKREVYTIDPYKPNRAFCALTLTLLCVACGDDTSPIGGAWYSGTRPAVSMDDRGAKGTLHRRVGDKQIDVGRDVYNYRWYPPDCIVWQTGRAVFGACGDRRPFPIAYSLSLDWEFLEDRINYLGSFRVDGGWQPPEWPEFIRIDSVRAVARVNPSWTSRISRPVTSAETSTPPSSRPQAALAVPDLRRGCRSMLRQ